MHAELTVHVSFIISVIAPGSLKRRTSRSKFYDLLSAKSEYDNEIYTDFKQFWLANRLLPSHSESESLK